MEQEQKIVEIAKTNEEIMVNFLEADAKNVDILLGVGLILTTVMGETGIRKEEILEEISKTIDIINKEKEKEGETENE